MRQESPRRASQIAQPRHPVVWFRVRSTGGGFIPCAWQGWLLIASMPFALLATQSFARLGWGSLTRHALGVALAAIYLLVISLTGGRTVWNWVFRFDK